MASLWPWESKSRNEDLSEVEKAVIGDTVPVETIEVFCTGLWLVILYIYDTCTVCDVYFRTCFNVTFTLFVCTSDPL